jgi:hypothetical protein
MTTYTAKYPDARTGLAHQYTNSGTTVTATGHYDYVSMTNTGGTATAPITATQSGGYGAYFEMHGFFNLVRANGPHTVAEFLGVNNTMNIAPGQTGRGCEVYADNLKAAVQNIVVNANGNSIGATKYGMPGIQVGPDAGRGINFKINNSMIGRDLVTLDKAWRVPDQAAWARGVKSDGHGGAMFTSPNGLLHIDFAGAAVSDVQQHIKYDALPINPYL